MITAVIKHEKNTLVTQFPVSNYDLSGQLGSIGITLPADKIPISGAVGIEVQLAENQEIGAAILKRLAEDDTLSGLNIACQLIAKCSPFGYDEFLDMLDPKPEGRYEFFRQYETLPPSAEPGVKGVLEEIKRYSVTMENYRAACEAEEFEDDEEWER